MIKKRTIACLAINHSRVLRYFLLLQRVARKSKIKDITAEGAGISFVGRAVPEHL
jgi:hypothetical protein